jgi:hypothetical protein
VAVVMAVVLGSPGVRVHRFMPPKSVECVQPLPAVSHTALSLLVRARSRVVLDSGRPNPKPSLSIYDSPGCRAVRDVTLS